MPDSRTRVLFLNSEYPPLGGGAANATRHLFLEYAKRDDVEIECITSAIDDRERVEEIAPNVRVHFLPIGDKRTSQHYQTQKELMTYLLRAWSYGNKLMQQKKFDVTHAFFTVPSGVPAWRWKQKLPYIVSLRGSDVPGFNERFEKFYMLLRPIIRRVWRDSARVVANSTDLMDLAHRTNRNQKISIIPNGIDVQRFPASVRSDGPLRVVFSSRLVGRKGLTFLLQAMEQLGDDLARVQLTIAGDGNLRAQLEDEVKQRGLSERVTFLGAVHPDEMPNVYQNADVFVLPSMNEGMSNSLLEAMSAGLAVVTTSTGGARDLVQGNGVIVPRRSSQPIADALKTYLNDPEKLAQHCKKSREVAESLSWSNIAGQYTALYKEVASNSGN